MVPYSLKSLIVIVVTCITLHNFIRQAARRDWFFEHYGKEDLVSNATSGVFEVLLALGCLLYLLDVN